MQAPYGYVLDSEPVYFDVEQSDSTEESGITVIEVVRSNLAQKGTITVSKSGEMFSSVSENNGLYQPVYAVGGLEGAVYEITAAEDIYTLDRTLRAEKGEVVDTVTTGADGTVKSKECILVEVIRLIYLGLPLLYLLKWAVSTMPELYLKTILAKKIVMIY